MIKKYSVSLLAASIAASVSFASNANDSLEVVDLGALEGAYETYPTGMNDAGIAVVVNRNLWNQNIRFELIDPERFEDEDLDNPDDNTYRLVRNALNDPGVLGGDPASQKLGQQISHKYDGQPVALEGFDSIDAETNRETDSVNYIGTDINDLDVIVGQAGEPYERRVTTNREQEEVQYFMRDSFPRAFVKEADAITFLPSSVSDLYQGGTSRATAVNNQNQAVGYAAVANTPNLTNRFDVCAEPSEDDAESDPSYEELNVCIWRYWYSQEVGTVANGGSRSPIFVEQAHAWEQSEQGEWQARHLGAYEAPEPTDEDAERLLLTSRAYDINEQGIAVGTAQRVVTYFEGTENVLVNTAVVFRDGELQDLQDEYRSQNTLATAINDDNIVVGYTSERAGLFNRDRAFYVDIEDPSAEPTYPLGFFNTSSWRPRAINNNKQVVGQGEVSTLQAAVRPTVGFLYDIESDTITDLNTLLPCDSGYQIIDAVDINDRGEILAIALTEIIIPIDDTQSSADRIRAVRLQAGSGEACGVEEETRERQGASMHPLVAGSMALFALLITLRRFRARS
ncbi:hypothetical protein CWE12_01940 [Aliidiomarina sedimenti]|uniref:DUF3466 domain-containing protein n=1 Tax=Aliidiomarina sedimenti TaxID=1933879 RepID=A0ABY0C1Q0_9GAMM|nr:DUF3466 family protein [Aliidiomarina sedimenti]RUO31785.1 hypothetical protein CWE12_01940 [Aliidiomarina sedimenti]